MPPCGSLPLPSRTTPTPLDRRLPGWHHRAVQPGVTVAVAVVGLRKTFGGVPALDGLDLRVPAGRIYGLLGPNGSGKTTLIRALAGLVRPDAGTVTVLGRTPREAVVAGMLGYMTQAAALYGELSIQENLRFFAELEGVPTSELGARVDDALRAVVGALSGGMRTRVSLAAALLHRPAVLLLDEPTVGVDPALRRDFWDHFRALARSGSTIVVSSHVMDEAARCDRLGLMRAGRLLAEGTVAELCAQAGTADLESAFLALSETA